jgi:NAD+ kinase
MIARRISLLANLHKAEAIPTARSVIARLRKAGVEVLLRRDLAEALGESGDDDSFLRADMILSLGGDGTLLTAVRALEGREIPILGINLGGLGFLTAVPSTEIDACLDTVLAGECRIEERRLLKATTREPDGAQLVLHALNDVVVDEGSFTRRAVVLKMSIDHSYVGTFTADGLIVATPTGSTAYALSAGGPIVHPALPALVVTPVCAHSLAIRPLVFGNGETVQIENQLPDADIKITADGQDAYVVGPGMPVHVGLSERKALLAFVGRRPYYEILRTKLNWGGIPKNR